MLEAVITEILQNVLDSIHGGCYSKPVDQITQIPWGHNLAIIAKCKNLDEALYYVQNTIAYGWSHGVLTHQIENGLIRGAISYQKEEYNAVL